MRAKISLLIAIGLAAAAATAVAASRSESQEPQGVLSALLVEVRGLRAAMEQLASAGPRVQLALGRLQLQEQRINTLVRRLEAVRDQLARAQREMMQHQAQIDQFEVDLKERSGAEGRPPREEIELMIAHMKREAARASAEVQRLTVEEAAIGGDIATEQARWTDFNQRLEELERSLGRR